MCVQRVVPSVAEVAGVTDVADVVFTHRVFRVADVKRVGAGLNHGRDEHRRAVTHQEAGAPRLTKRTWTRVSK